MSETLRLDLQVGGFNGLEFMDRFVDQLERAADAQDRLNESTKNGNQTRRALPALSGSGAVPSAMEGTRVMQTVQQLISKSLPGAGGIGGGRASLFSGPSVGGVGSAGFRIAGMGGQLASALGGAAGSALSLGVALHGVLGPISALAGAAIRAATHLKEIAAARFVAGSSTEEMAKLSAIASAFGMSPSQAAGTARSWYDAAQNNPVAQAAIMQAGGQPFGGPWGNQNAGDQWMKTLEYARRLPESQARSFATRAGLDPSVVGQARLIEDTQWNRLKSSVPKRSKADEAAGIRLMTEFQMSWNHLESIFGSFARLLLPTANSKLRSLNEFLAQFSVRLGEVIDRITKSKIWKATFGDESGDGKKARSIADIPFDIAGNPHKVFGGAAMDPFFGPIEKKWDELFGSGGQKSAGRTAGGVADQVINSQAQNTRAINRLTDTLENGFYGRGADAGRRAVPAGLEANIVRGLDAWQAYDRSLKNLSMAMGGISI